MSALWADPSVDSDDIESAVEREVRRQRRETLAAMDRFDEWRRVAPHGSRCAHISSTGDATPGREVMAIAYTANSFVETKGYGRGWIEALEDLARAGAARGMW